MGLHHSRLEETKRSCLFFTVIMNVDLKGLAVLCAVCKTITLALPQRGERTPLGCCTFSLLLR